MIERIKANKAIGTAGPWTVNPIRAQVDAYQTGELFHGTLPVCQLLWPTEERSEEETAANGARIASVPEMEDALIACETALENVRRILNVITSEDGFASPGSAVRQLVEDAQDAVRPVLDVLQFEGVE